MSVTDSYRRDRKRVVEGKGVGGIISAYLMRLLKESGVKYAETNLNLETNHAILNQWKRFKAVQHKRRRAYVKKLK